MITQENLKILFKNLFIINFIFIVLFGRSYTGLIIFNFRLGEIMSLANARPGANYVPAYQASGIPFIATAGTGATKTIEFNKVTLEVTVANAGTDSSTVNFGLTNSTDFTIPANSVATFRVKTKKIVIHFTTLNTQE